MKSPNFSFLLVVTLIFLTTCIPLISSQKVGYNSLDYGEKVRDGFNYSINVNNSDFFGGYSVLGLRGLYEVYYNGIYCQLVGCTMSGNIDMDSNDILNAESITGNNISANNLIGYQIGNSSIWSRYGGDIFPTAWNDYGPFSSPQLGLGTNTPETILDIRQWSPEITLRSTSDQPVQFHMGDSIGNLFTIFQYSVTNGGHTSISTWGNMNITSMFGNVNILNNLNVQENITSKNIYPQTTLTYSLGSGALRWLGLFVQNISAENIDAYNLYLTDNLNVTKNVFIGGNVTFKRPSATYTSTETQTIPIINTAYPVTFNWTEDSYLINKINNTNFSVSQEGKYQMIFSAICQSAVAGKHVEIWIQKNGVNIPRTDTLYEFKGANAETVIVVPFEVPLNLTDSFRIMWASDDTGTTMVYKTNTSYSPETPSIIMEVNKISALT
jgi:hypothetical protein